MARALDPDLDRWLHIPGWELIGPGLTDLAEGRTTINACLVSMGRSRLRAAGLPVGETELPDPEGALYRMLSAEHDNWAHEHYNSLVQRLVRFARGAEGLISGDLP